MCAHDLAQAETTTTREHADMLAWYDTYLAIESVCASLDATTRATSHIQRLLPRSEEISGGNRRQTDAVASIATRFAGDSFAVFWPTRWLSGSLVARPPT